MTKMPMLRHGERSVNDLVVRLKISQPGGSKHLRVLREAGLVEVRPEGRRRWYGLRPQPLAEVDAWLEPYRKYWSGRLAEAHELRIVASPGEVLRPQVTRTRELIEAGAIGQLSWALCGGALGEYHEREELERVDAPGGAPINPAWYFRKPGGGPLYDVTVYSLHQLTSILGPAQAVTALSGIRIRERDFLGSRIPTEADDNTILLLDFGDGVLAVAYGTAAGEHSDQFGAGLYFGTRGTIDGILLNGEPFDFPCRELTTEASPSDWDVQMRVLPHVAEPIATSVSRTSSRTSCSSSDGSSMARPRR